MPYLDTYTTPLTAATAAHLLRRATFGPTQQEITDFTGKTAAQAVGLLISNVSYTLSPTPPLDLSEGQPNSGKPLEGLPFSIANNYTYGQWIKYWWIGLMTEQKGHPSVLEKLTVFWQNHFVTRFTSVEDYRYTYRYLKLLRSNALGNFRTFVTEITKDPAMLIFQNGNENQKGKPNENYAREMQELFVVGAKDFNQNPNYTESDVKAAAKVLTGWQCTNHSFGDNVINSFFTIDRHDTTDKTFSSHYNNTVITGRSGANAGDQELNDLVTMMLNHSHTAKFICRKLYRWYVNPEVTQDIENNVIAPLASFFSSSANNYAIQPVLEKLLSSQIFYDNINRGVIIKSPAELVIGTLRYFKQPVPDISTEYGPFNKLTEFQSASMIDMQMNLLDQPSVFGFTPYYQTGFSKNWINASTLAIRSYFANCLVYRSIIIKPGYALGLDLLAMVTAMQPNFSDAAGTPPITCLQVLDGFTKNLFAIELPQEHKDYIVDHIMMTDQPRSDWTYVWDLYRKDTANDTIKNGVRWRCELLMAYVLRMAEYNVF